jgi:hypothetical protein
MRTKAVEMAHNKLKDMLVVIRGELKDEGRKREVVCVLVCVLVFVCACARV